MADATKKGFLQRLKGALGEGSDEAAPDRRASKRIALPIPVRLRISGGDATPARLRDISQQGLCVEPVGEGKVGEAVVVRFEGYPDVCDPFVLAGKIVRRTDEEPPALVIHIDRGETPTDALRQYRALVLHYIHHRPLLDEVGKGYFEGRCNDCDWIGRVGAKKPTCPMCGGRVSPIE